MPQPNGKHAWIKGAKGAGAPGPAVQWARRGPPFAKRALDVGAYAGKGPLYVRGGGGDIFSSSLSLSIKVIWSKNQVWILIWGKHVERANAKFLYWSETNLIRLKNKLQIYYHREIPLSIHGQI
ncbi:hypothetical protein NQ317_005498 [Molorchus minor]|uniref:Uncharacterized protein n=1 Tax=Molorchus minor TaxID=1323400 RepID=A0ABQ9J2C9_9CUCU|nr:hypothetical protein NQ317_005498 [Molorchus minor]